MVRQLQALRKLARELTVESATSDNVGKDGVKRMVDAIRDVELTEEQEQQGLYRVCARSVQGLHKLCTRSAQSPYSVCTKSVQGRVQALRMVCTESARRL